MASIDRHRPPERLLIVMPSWVGDTVMAMPTVRALRGLYPESYITALARPLVAPMVDACPWVDRIITAHAQKSRPDAKRRVGPFRLARRLARADFDMAVLLPNSFRAALLMRMAGIPRRVGYDRDGRGFLLTDRLLARRQQRGGFVPVATRDYYLNVARYLGSVDPPTHLELFTRPEQDLRARQMLAQAGVDDAALSKLVLLNPGANYGDAKMWFADRFAAVAERCTRELGATVAVSGAPKERAILEQVRAAAKTPIVDLQRAGIDLTLLKSVVKMSRLMVTNDTGPRHIATALGVPVVTIFGPTDPAWSENHFELERKVMVSVFCGPCQKRKCPLDHRCMTQVTPDMVFARVVELFGARQMTPVTISGPS